MYLHIGRGIYYFSFFKTKVWFVGVVILFLVIAAAFLGYVLPWGQISFWGATVITNLFSAIPYIGSDIVIWLWGGFRVDNPTLVRFFSIHFLVPFIVTVIVIIHLFYLHESGSSNPLGVNRNYIKIIFYPYYLVKDFLGFIVFFIVFFFICLIEPWTLGDPENFNFANPLVTPIHIQPEWYFLFAYAILRSIPRKLGGVVALVLSILILFTLPFLNSNKIRSIMYYPFSVIYFWLFIVNVILLTWAGARPVEEPYVVTSQILSITYFLYYFLDSQIKNKW
jgi:ubiquinol-cytochrome c reductase cytochrome b subunit